MGTRRTLRQVTTRFPMKLPFSQLSFPSGLERSGYWAVILQPTRALGFVGLGWVLDSRGARSYARACRARASGLEKRGRRKVRWGGPFWRGVGRWRRGNRGAGSEPARDAQVDLAQAPADTSRRHAARPERATSSRPTRSRHAPSRRNPRRMPFQDCRLTSGLIAGSRG